MLSNFQRLSVPNKELTKMYGPLAGLIGIWSGNKGVNLVAVPDQKGGFTLLIAPYSETLTVTAISSPTPNRGLKTIAELPTLMYSLSIYNSIDNSLMHVENGFWEVLDPKQNDGFNIVRLATIPHGDSLAALGTSLVTPGGPVIDTSFSALPTGGLPPIFGYTENYDGSDIPGYNPKFPNQYLADYLNEQQKQGLTITETTTLPVRTVNSGGIVNIPSIVKNTNTPSFEATFWIETVKDEKTGKSFQQLQYTQNTVIEFPVKGTPKGKTIEWPHVNVNTLVKQ